MELPPLTESQHDAPDARDAHDARFGRWFVGLAVVALLVLALAFSRHRGAKRAVTQGTVSGGVVAEGRVTEGAAAGARAAGGGGSPFRRGARAPDGVRVRVEVLNATKTRGLARRATLYLRDRGFDVVDMGTAAQQLDTTLVIDRSGHPEWARRVADAMGSGARVVERPDTSRYLDVTVQIGATWRPPAKPFYP